jgi:chemotaxis regulatin CheY-phosphate phosphatase CheZ
MAVLLGSTKKNSSKSDALERELSNVNKSLLKAMSHFDKAYNLSSPPMLKDALVEAYDKVTDAKDRVNYIIKVYKQVSK